jgi:hypothetical protein
MFTLTLLTARLAAAPAPAAAAAAPAAATPTSADGALDFTADAKLLFRVVACEGDLPLPANIDAKILEEHCKELHRRMDKFKKTEDATSTPRAELNI